MAYWQPSFSSSRICFGKANAAFEHSVLQILELVEQKQRVVAGATDEFVVGRTFLLSVRFTDGTVQFENQFLERLALLDLVDPIARQVHQRC